LFRRGINSFREEIPVTVEETGEMIATWTYPGM